MDPNNPLYQRYKKIAEELKAEFGCEVSVVKKNEKSVMPFITNADGVTVYAIISGKDKEKIIKIQRKEFRTYVLQIMPPIEELIELTHSSPKMIRNNLGGTGFIPPFLFHEEIIGNYSKQLRERFAPVFRRELDFEINERLKRLQISDKVIKEMIELRNKKIRERSKKIIGQLEGKDIEDSLRAMAEYITEQKSEILIFFDKSARPLALPLKKILKEKHNHNSQVFFIDPEQLSAGIPPKHIAENFKKEHPYLAKALRGRTVCLIDDQVWNGKAIKKTIEFLQKFHPKKVNATYMSIYPAEPQPSWRTQGIHSVIEPKYARRVFVSGRKKLSAEEQKRIAGLRKRMQIITQRVISRKKK